MMKRPYPSSCEVAVGIGPLVSRAGSKLNLSLFTLRWWEKVLVLCFSQITFRLMSL